MTLCDGEDVTRKYRDKPLLPYALAVIFGETKKRPTAENSAIER